MKKIFLTVLISLGISSLVGCSKEEKDEYNFIDFVKKINKVIKSTVLK